jgi:hypothetical protein
MRASQYHLFTFTGVLLAAIRAAYGLDNGGGARLPGTWPTPSLISRLMSHLSLVLGYNSG